MADIRENAITLLTSVNGIDATAIGVTSLFNVPMDRTFIPHHIILRCTNFTEGGKSIQAVANFGGNSPDFNDYLNNVTYTFTQAGVYIRDSIEDTESVTQVEGTEFSINIVTASNATTEIWSVDTFGYLL